MVLPNELMEIFSSIKDKYSQTCSKAEQICLALYMEEGYYHRNIKKCRRFYASKLETTIKQFREYGAGAIEPLDSHSGLNLLLKIKTGLTAEQVCCIARDLGLVMRPVDDMCSEDEQVVSFYFYRVSEALLKLLIKMFVQNIAKAGK